MNKFLFFIVLSFVATFTFAQTIQTVTTGAGYANEVYFSFENGSVKTSARSAWDIAFTADQMDVSILVNNGNGVELYTYPDGDLSNWAETLDISAIDTWNKMYNSHETWTEGAFLMNALDHPDYGWGIYNDVTHNIIGDSIFIIKLASGVYKKLAIVEKNAVANTWDFKYADLEGANESIVNFDADNYTDLNFIHYSIENDLIVDQEAAKDTWELLFTKYWDNSIPYNVTGVLSNFDVLVQEVSENGLDQATYNTYNTELLSEVMNTIGSDWKAFNMGTMSYDLADTVVFFVQDLTDVNLAIWKLYFTGFAGSTTGEYTFVTEQLTGTGVNELNTFSTIYPNPARDIVNLIYDIDGTCEVLIHNISGQLVYKEMITHNNHLNKQVIPVNKLTSGLYNLTVRNGNVSSTVKFVKN